MHKTALSTKRETVVPDKAIDLAGLMETRAHAYGLLARLFREEIDKETMRGLCSMRFPTSTGNSSVDEGYRLLHEYLKYAWDDSITELAIDYARTFIGHGVNGYSAAYPFESVYTSERRLLMQDARAEVLKVLRSNDLKRGNWTEGEDHIALELEFMQRMSMRTAEALRIDDEDSAIKHVQTQQAFIRTHLLNWLPLLVADMRQFSRTKFYQGLASLLMGYLEEDDAVLTELLDA
jgi:TorA-specific chaperone